MSTSLQAALRNSAPIVMDGAMGTELTRIGSFIGSKDWVSSILGHPDQVARIHRDYAEAGAQIHIANTFAAAGHVLEKVGLTDRFEELNRGAVEVCQNAIAEAGPDQKWIAGSISTYVIGSDRADLPRGAKLQEYVRAQADVLANAGCHMLALEMLFDVETSGEIMAAAQSAGLPISVGLTCVRDEAGRVCLRGEYSFRRENLLPLADALPEIVAAASGEIPWVMTIMHSDMDITDDAVQIMRQHWAGPIGVYPNSGKLLPPDRWDHDSVCSRSVFVSHAEKWISQGAMIVGGCCGVGPAHIAKLAAHIH